MRYSAQVLSSKDLSLRVTKIKNSELILSSPYLTQEAYTISIILWQARRSTTQAPPPTLQRKSAPGSLFSHCRGFCSGRVIGLEETTWSHQISASCPRRASWYLCYSPQMRFKTLPRGLQQEESMTPEQYFPVLYHHCLWENFPNVLSKFAPIQFKPLFVLSLVLMSEQFSSSLPMWKLLHCVPSDFSSLDQTSPVSPASAFHPAPWRVQVPLSLYLVDLLLKA